MENELLNLINKYKKMLNDWKRDLRTDDSIGSKAFNEREYALNIVLNDLTELGNNFKQDNSVVEPFFATADDYHEFKDMKESLNKIFLKNGKDFLDFKEIGYDHKVHGSYIAIFFPKKTGLAEEDSLKIILQNTNKHFKDKSELASYVLNTLSMDVSPTMLEDVIDSCANDVLQVKKIKNKR